MGGSALAGGVLHATARTRASPNFHNAAPRNRDGAVGWAGAHAVAVCPSSSAMCRDSIQPLAPRSVETFAQCPESAVTSGARVSGGPRTPPMDVRETSGGPACDRAYCASGLCDVHDGTREGHSRIRLAHARSHALACCGSRIRGDASARMVDRRTDGIADRGTPTATDDHIHAERGNPGAHRSESLEHLARQTKMLLPRRLGGHAQRSMNRGPQLDTRDVVDEVVGGGRM